MARKFEVDSLEERIAPSTLSLESLGDDLGNVTSHDNSLADGTFGSHNDASIGSSNSVDLSTGHIASGNSVASGNHVDASNAASGNTISPTVSPSFNVSPSVDLGGASSNGGGGLLGGFM